MAERIARRMAAGAAPVAGEFVRCGLRSWQRRASLNELQNRLVQIESKVGSVPRVHSPWSHPSLERFGVEEATVSELVDFFQNEKAVQRGAGW